MNIDPNVFYRITNLALGGTLSLDVVSAAGGVNLTSTDSTSGQIWQFINPIKSGQGPYYLTSSLLGPGEQLDFSSAIVGGNQAFVPFVKPFAVTDDQTWIVKAHTDVVGGVNTATVAIEPNVLNGTMALTASKDSNQPFLGQSGVGSQHWVLTPVMNVNNASFSTSAFLALATPTSKAASTAKSPSSQTTAVTTGLSATSSPIPATAGQASPAYSIPKSALIAIIAAPVLAIFVLLLVTGTFICLRRKARKRKEAQLMDEKMDQYWKDSKSQVYLGARAPFGTAATCQYAPSIVSSESESASWFGRSSQPDNNNVFSNTLEPPPPSRPSTYLQDRSPDSFYGASTLRGTLDGKLRSPNKLRPAKLGFGSQRGTIDVDQLSPRSAYILIRHDTPPQSSAATKSGNRQESWMSRWSGWRS